MRKAGALAIGMLLVAAGAGHALTLAVPRNAVETARSSEGPRALTLPTGVAEAGKVPTREVTGQVVQQALRIEGGGITPLQLMEPLKAQLEEAGFSVTLECAARTCGGFDFRFALDLFPAPDLFVDLFNYRYLSAERDGAVVTILTSRTANRAYMQITTLSPEGAEAVTIGTEGAQVVGPPVRAAEGAEAGAAGAVQAALQEALQETGGVVERMRATGSATLTDLEFATGSAELGTGPFASLQALATYLNTTPDARVALVGHTDAVGGLAGNIALSKQRAASVLERLAGAYGVARGQMEAEGVGFLAPRAANTSAEGREANRRVEVVLVSGG